MRRFGLLWQFFPPLLTILVVSIVLVTGFSGRAIRSFMVDHTADNLESFAKALTPDFTARIQSEDYAGVQDICRRLGHDSGYRLTVILSDGKVVGDSDEDPALMENHADRPEVFSAIKGHPGSSRRYSSTLGHQRLYVAVPGNSSFVVRTSISLEDLGGIMRHLYGEIALVSLALVVLAGLLGFILARKVSSSLQQLQNGAEAFAAGQLNGRIKVDDSLEINAVATSMNHMADQLAQRIRTTENQRNELEAVLASMNEGVLAVDRNQNIIRLNNMAAELLDQDRDYALGRSIQEIGRHPELTRLTEEILNGGTSVEKEVQLGGRQGKMLRVQAGSLVNLDHECFGVLLVMSDMTELRRLETMRRDFVANVSHELKTPVTSIKGFVETLLDEPPDDAAETKRFLNIIDRQTDRVENIISDLLALSRLEEENRTGNLEMIESSLDQLLGRVIRDLTSFSPEAAGRLNIECNDSLRLKINAPLLEQAIGNLINNALKYSPESSPVRISCTREADEVLLSVTDQGPGISSEHLPRIFERFYRVDKARSRRMGGTGLGLAIVKHITQIHGGQATVTSTPGEGSTFTMKLPLEGPR
jgi:two-component system, OmpR family, phosphate regulon sensor histidine kinase PhoR